MTKRLEDLVVWQISDGKPGHERQVIGLVNALERVLIKHKLELHKFNGGAVKALIELYAKKRYLKKKPNLIVGAGHKTHLTIILLSKILGGKSICLMKPSIPTKLFDLCIIPKHDNINGTNVFITQGPLNPLKNSGANKKGGLILVGGPSKHFHFSKDEVLKSIRNILSSNPATKWSIADSRRTPEQVKKRLVEMQSESLKYYDSNYTSSSILDEKLEQTEFAWITADSMAMIYEALTAGAKVGIINLQQKIDSNLVRHIKSLTKEETVNSKACFLKMQICESEIVAKKITNLFLNEFQT